MNAERDSFYITLGLRSGASPSEIKTAYRQLAKLYHPDHDRSPDAEVKYREIRAAYEALRDWHLAGGADEPAVANNTSSERVVWTAEDWGTEWDTWTAEDWATLHDTSRKRIPLEWKRLPSIFIRSVKEMSIGVYLRGVFSFMFAFASADVLHGLMPSAYVLTSLFYIASWIFFVFVRYYFSPYDWSFFTRVVAGMVQGALLIILIACFYSIPRESLIEAGSWAAASVWILVVHLDRKGL